MVVDVVITGHVRGKPHEIESIENPRGLRSGGEKVKRTYRIFEIEYVEAIEGGASSAELENKRVIVYPSQGVRSCPSVYEQMLLFEAGNGDTGLSNYLELFGTYAKADKKGPFAGTINVWKVNSLKEDGPQYREGKKEMLELLKT